MGRKGKSEKPIPAAGTVNGEGEASGTASPWWAVKVLPSALLCLLSVTLLSLSFAPLDYWYLAYLSLVPWTLAVSFSAGWRRAMALGWLAGVVFWAANLYWLWWITLVGYGALVLYLSIYWVAAAAILRRAQKRRWPMCITLPVVWVALEYLRAYVISGFPWFYLAHSQWSRTALIQVSDLTGQYGVSFFVAMVNGAVVDVVLVLLARADKAKARSSQGIAMPAAVVTVTAAAILGYGYWRLAQRTTSPGPVVATVQQDYPISLSLPRPSDEKMLADQIAGTQRFRGSGVDLVIWAESMLPSFLNPEMLQLDIAGLSSGELRSLAGRFYGKEVWEVRHSDEVIRSNLEAALDQARLWHQARMVGDLSADMGCPILAGGATIHRNGLEPVDDDDQWVTRNSVLWFDRSPLASGIYSKMHLVPFSEYVPFKTEWLGLHRVLRRFVPPVMEQLAPGKEMRPFEVSGNGQTWSVAVPICYEGTFARICRQMVMDNGTKQAGVLLNLSNDGWFVYKKFGRGSYQGSTEHSQHLVQYCFRAVENRVPVVRAVNTGISASIDSNGRIVADVGLSLEGYRKRTMIPGALLLDGKTSADGKYAANHGPSILVDSRVSVYSLAGDVFALCVSAVGAVMFALLMRRPGANEDTAK